MFCCVFLFPVPACGLPFVLFSLFCFLFLFEVVCYVYFSVGLCVSDDCYVQLLGWVLIGWCKVVCVGVCTGMY